MKLTPEMLTGKSREHLVNLPATHSSNHFLQTQAVQAFQGLQQSAAKKPLIYSQRVVFVILKGNSYLEQQI